jgi:hypothetical protein
MKIYGLPSEDRKEIIEQRQADSKKWLVVPGIDGPVIHPTHDQYLLAGWVLKVAPVIGENQYQGGTIITDTEWTYQVIDKTPAEIWEKSMQASDSIMSRAIEELWDAIGIDKAPDYTKEKHATKKALRAQKP